uniref:type I protein arginine methyltransferase n=1 Tax=Trichobilharzia regenti TaxID=157069 RepID=A0AA85J0B7_TRIRE|nr:unnamed protein product [Trichobilharzia regenti]
MSELIIPNGNSTDSEYESDGWQEVTVPDSASPEKYICLVCDVNCDSVVGFFRHLTIQHEWVNLLDGEGRSIFNDQYDWIRFVNFVRKTKPTDLRQAFFDMVWKTDSMDLLYPVLTDDEVLSIDIESYLVDNSQNEQVVNGTVLSNGLNAGATGTTYSRELIIERPSQELLRLVEENRTLRAQLNNCKLLLSNMAKEPVRTKSSSRSPDRKSDIIEPNDSSYFGSYGHFEIHGEMINDRIRTDSYVNFILSNSDKYFKDKIILDVGSGSGILSMIASKAGAKHVYGVEAADEIYAASHETLRVNNLLDRITIIHGQAESVELPVKKVDVIISEWMGYFLFFESMLDSVLNIASKYLSPDGYIFPRHYTLHLLGVQCSDKLRQRRLEHWNNVYGYNMPALRRAALSEAHILNLTNEQTPSSPLLFSPNVSLASLQSSFATCSSESGKTTSPITILTSQPYELIDIDLCDMHKQRVYNLTNNSSILCEQNFSLLIQPSNLSTKISGTFKLDAIVGYFNVRFNDAADVKVEFSTSPTAPLTHWKQTLLFLDKPILVKPSDLVTGKITIRRATLDNRGLEITLKINGTMDYPEDLTCFAKSDFNHVQWINEALKPYASDPNYLDQKVSDLVLQLQNQMKDVMQTLDHACQEAISFVPRVLREMESVKTDATILDSDLKSLQHDNLQMDNNSQSIVTSLVELDRTRRNAQSAADALRETDRWINLIQCINELFETEDLDQLCSTIESMDQCLISLIYVNDYEERVKAVDKYKNNLESLIAPQLIQSLDELNSIIMQNIHMMMNNGGGDDENNDHGSDYYTSLPSLTLLPTATTKTLTSVQPLNDYRKCLRKTNHLLNLLYRIGRENAAKKYYTNWLKDQLTSFWNRSMSQTITESATLTTTAATTTDTILLTSLVQDLSAYPSNLIGVEKSTKMNYLSSTVSENDKNSSTTIKNIIYFYALIIIFFKGQLGAKLFTAPQKEQNSTRPSYPIGILVDFTESLESLKSFQKFTNSISDYYSLGCLFRVTVKCLHCFEELLVPIYSDIMRNNQCSSDVNSFDNNDSDSHHKKVKDNFVENFKNAFTRLIQTMINPFIGLPELFAKHIRQQFDQELNKLNITVGNNLSDVWKKLNEDVVSRSLGLFCDAINLCFEATGAISTPFILDIIHSYWDSLIAKWMVWNNWIEKQLVKSDSDLGYNQAYGFMWVIKFAHLTGDLSSQSDTFVEYAMSKCTDWLSQILNADENIITPKEKNTLAFSSTKNDNSSSNNNTDNLPSRIPNILLCILRQLVLKQSSECQHSIKIIAHSSGLTTPPPNEMTNHQRTLTSSTMLKTRSNLHGFHKSSSMLCRATVGIVRQVALAPIRYYLKPVKDLTIWFTYPNNGEVCLPDMAYLPQDYITQIGQYLFMLPGQLEPYLSTSDTSFEITEGSQFDDSPPSLSSTGLTQCLYLGDLETSYTITSHKISESQQQQQQQQQQVSPTTSSALQQQEASGTTTTSKTPRKRLLSSNFSHQMKSTPDNTKTPNESFVYYWLENLISVNVCDLIINTILQIGMNKSAVKPLTKESKISAINKTSKSNGDEDVDGYESDNDADDQPLLTKHGLKQLDVDLGYLFSMLHDLGVTVPSNLQTLRDLINCDAEQFPKLCADRPPKIVNTVANFRGF